MTEPPKHPGELLARVLKTLNRSQVWLAAETGLSTKHINQICSGATHFSPRSAVLLEEATGVAAEVWLTLQMTHDLAVAREAYQDLRASEQTRREVSAGAAQEEAQRAIREALAPVLGNVEPYRRPG